jgi:hypothetical protein
MLSNQLSFASCPKQTTYDHGHHLSLDRFVESRGASHGAWKPQNQSFDGAAMTRVLTMTFLVLEVSFLYVVTTQRTCAMWPARTNYLGLSGVATEAPEYFHGCNQQEFFIGLLLCWRLFFLGTL